jgi:DNA-binding NarL/FixJ family response regulator
MPTMGVAEGAGHPRATVLLVDDDRRFRELARKLLESDGYLVVGEASTAVGGVDLARRLRPDVVVLDLVMPELDAEMLEPESPAEEVLIDLVSAEASGLRAAAELSHDDTPPAVVIVSSLFDTAVEQRARKLGARYVDKVSGIDALERAIDAQLAERVLH